jgi:hypothetical protein
MRIRQAAPPDLLRQSVRHAASRPKKGIAARKNPRPGLFSRMLLRGVPRAGNVALLREEHLLGYMLILLFKLRRAAANQRLFLRALS